MATQANFYPNLKQCACPDRWYTHVLGLFLFSGWAVPLMAGGAPWSLAVGALWLVGYIAVCMNAYDERGLYTMGGSYTRKWVSFWFRIGGMGGVAGRLTASGNDHTDAGFGFCHRRSRWLVLPKGLGCLIVEFQQKTDALGVVFETRWLVETVHGAV